MDIVAGKRIHSIFFSLFTVAVNKFKPLHSNLNRVFVVWCLGAFRWTPKGLNGFLVRISLDRGPGGGVGRKTGVDYIYELFIFKKNVPVKKKKPTRQKNIISDRVTKFATRAKKSQKYPCKEKWACWKRKMAKKVSMQIKKYPCKNRKNGQKLIARGRKKTLLTVMFEILTQMCWDNDKCSRYCPHL